MKCQVAPATALFVRLACLCLLLWAALPLASATEAKGSSDPVVVRSPDGRLAVALFTRAASGAPSQLQYRVSLSVHAVVNASNLGVRLKDGTELGRNCVVVGSESVQIDTSFEQYPGKRRHVVDRATETTLTLRERGAKPLEWQLVVRAYDDGVALRYRFLKQPGWSDLELADERTEFAFPAGAVTTALPLESFTTSHEGRYERRRVDEIPADKLLALPLLVELPKVGWAAVLEANLTDYAGMYLARGAAPAGVLVSRLSPRPGEPKIAIRATLPHDSPWRLILIGKAARQLIESDTVLKLNAPSVIKDTSWIKPGKTTFPWWNDYYEVGVPFKMGLNTETMKHYIDFCAEYGIPYHTLDGVNDLAWYGGHIAPYEGADITQGIDGLDFQEVIRYAQQKGVRLRLWMHWEAAKRHMARAFPLYRAWGIEGVMIDFMDRDDQEMVNFQRELLQLAAENQLTVTFHGVAAPTGLERTYPNLLNSEAVRNLEYDKWDEDGVTPEHDVTVPLTRMLAGPLDYHQGTLRGVPLERFKPRVAEPVVIGTPVRMLASYVVLQNHLPMMADYPSAYRRHPLTRVMAAVPTTWDDTRALVAQVGEEVVIARRNGNDWWIGAMTDRNARKVPLSLSFLPAGKFQAEIYRDDLAAEYGFKRETHEVTSSDKLSLQLAESGGALVRLTPAKRRPTEFGVCFHHGAFGNEYTPAAASVLDDLRSAGKFWIRGDYQDPEKDARFATDMKRKGIQVLALLPWYSKDTSGWPAYVRRQVQATPDVPAWEITNEPEMTWWGGPIPAASYMRMLREAHAIIKAANRKARVVGPAVGATAEGAAYLNSLIDMGLLEWVDAISVHYYVFHRSMQLDEVKRIVAGRKPIWITETGWTTADQEGGEKSQQMYIQTHYDRSSGILGADPAVEVIFNYELNDEHYPALPGKDDGWGLTYGPEGGFGKKAAYQDFKKLLAAPR